MSLKSAKTEFEKFAKNEFEKSAKVGLYKIRWPVLLVVEVAVAGQLVGGGRVDKLDGRRHAEARRQVRLMAHLASRKEKEKNLEKEKD